MATTIAHYLIVYGNAPTLESALDEALTAWARRYNGQRPANLVVPDSAPPTLTHYNRVDVWRASTIGLALRGPKPGTAAPWQVAAGPVPAHVAQEEPGYVA